MSAYVGASKRMAQIAADAGVDPNELRKCLTAAIYFKRFGMPRPR